MTPELAEITVRNNSQRTKYLALERGRLPPISAKYEDLSQFDEEIRPVLEAFFNGELIVKWSCGANQITDVLGGSITLSIEGYIPSDPVPVKTIFFNEETAIHRATGGIMMSIVHDNRKFDRLLKDEEEGAAIEVVMLLRFFREAGGMMADILPKEYFIGVVFVATQRFQQLKRYKDSLDLWLTFSDICLGNSLKYVDRFILKVADELQANKMYKEGANLYVELATDGVYTGQYVPKAVLHSYAGQAFARAMDYVSSEREYIASLREYGPNWEWTDPPQNDPSNVLWQMMGMYCKAGEAFATGLFTDKANKRLNDACVVLTGLLTWAGCMTPNYPQFGQAHVVKEALKPQFRQRQAAFDAVFRDVFMAPDVTEYHNRLNSCRLSGATFDPLWLDGSEAMFVKEQKRLSKQSARTWIQDRSGTGIFIQICAGCKTFENDRSLKMKQCPCKTVSYCSEACQRDHWPIHKKSCAIHAKKKKKK